MPQHVQTSHRPDKVQLGKTLQIKCTLRATTWNTLLPACVTTSINLQERRHTSAGTAARASCRRASWWTISESIPATAHTIVTIVVAALHKRLIDGCTTASFEVRKQRWKTFPVLPLVSFTGFVITQRTWRTS
ncbi:uncharacterized protein LOC144107887 isoform X2 [Amblyomma americanum]